MTELERSELLDCIDQIEHELHRPVLPGSTGPTYDPLIAGMARLLVCIARMRIGEEPR